MVHSYGAVCQSITEFVQTKSYKVTSREFHDLNLSLDCAIAEAVTEFEKVKIENINDIGIEQIGFLIHEMGNTLTAASIAHGMIQKGSVGGAGNTSRVLSQCHEHMWRLIGKAQVEIRLRGHTALEHTCVLLSDITDEVKATAVLMVKSNEIQLEFDIDPAIQLTVDRHLIFSAISNLVNNAIKFTKKSGAVSLRARESGDRILIEVEDECGGLPEGKIEDLFKPFSQKGSDKSGMGLGLSLSRRAIELNQGKFTVLNIPKKGCIFTISLPKNKQIA